MLLDSAINSGRVPHLQYLAFIGGVTETTLHSSSKLETPRNLLNTWQRGVILKEAKDPSQHPLCARKVEGVFALLNSAAALCNLGQYNGRNADS